MRTAAAAGVALVLSLAAGCGSGKTAPLCESPSVVCGSTCVDLQTDHANCGACGKACADGEVCSKGACAATCDKSLTRCPVAGGPDVCSDTNVDPANCGGCGNACTAPAGEVGICTGGSCGAVCAPGRADCDASAADGCEVDLASDPDNCGACGHVCPSANGTATCTDGKCGITCDTGFADCDGDLTDGCEVDTNVDPANCGTCGKQCPAEANAAPACAGGQCGVACDAGYGDCNGSAADGCETTLGTATDCLACSDACTVGANAAPACGASGCFAACDAGYLDCDQSPTNGCEIDGQTDAHHCGACGTDCTTGPKVTGGTCGAGSCNLTCATGYADCNADPSDGCEVDTNTDVAHCGDCTTTCTAAQICDAGTCGPPPAGTLDQSYPYSASEPRQNGLGGPGLWQSYVAGISGHLGQVAFWPEPGLCATVTLDVYAGEGIGGQLLGHVGSVKACGASPGLLRVPANVVIPQTAGSTYTLEFNLSGSDSLSASAANQYPNGCQSWKSALCSRYTVYDVNFQTWVR